MKVGTHAQEPLEDIIARKTKEIEDAGIALWGYGGNTCHPQTMVQPFAQVYEERGEKVYLCMEEMQSNHLAEQIRADQFSVDGLKWEDIPRSIKVLGSRYALVIKNLRREDVDISLANTCVAVGNSKGRSGDKYIAGRVDKACLEILKPSAEGTKVHIRLIADLYTPYAVFLRNRS
jgi:hypothetical protein